MTARHMTEGEREELIALEKNATPGPWSAEPGTYVHTGWTVITARGEGMPPNSPLAIIGAISNLLGAEEAMKDAAFIAAMRNALPYLLSTSAAVRGMREALQLFRDHYPRGINPWLDEAHSKARAALSGIEGEDEQATRGEDAATAPTDS